MSAVIPVGSACQAVACVWATFQLSQPVGSEAHPMTLDDPLVGTIFSSSAVCFKMMVNFSLIPYFSCEIIPFHHVSLTVFACIIYLQANATSYFD